LTFAGLGSVANSDVIPITEVFEPAGSFPATQFMKVAVIQSAPPSALIVGTAAEAETFKSRNRDLIAALIRQAAAQGAKLVVASEMVVVGYPYIPNVPPEDMNFNTREEILPYAETIPGTSSIYFSALAKELSIYIQFGMAEIDAQSLLHNSAVAVGPDGSVLAVHRKVNLFKQESNYFTPGVAATVYNTPAGRIGMMICADVYTSSLLNAYKGAVEVLSLSTSWDTMNTGWGSFTNAAKFDNAYIMAANQPYFPDSGVAKPTGDTQSHIRQTSGIAYGYLPLKSNQQ
jgi:predicted amidohydrolase